MRMNRVEVLLDMKRKDSVIASEVECKIELDVD